MATPVSMQESEAGEIRTLLSDGPQTISSAKIWDKGIPLFSPTGADPWTPSEQQPYHFQVPVQARAGDSGELDDDFKSAVTSFSKTTYYTARTSSGILAVPLRLNEFSTYAKALKSKMLWPVNPNIEQNWSGRGQHVEFKLNERDRVRRILPVRDVLGRTGSATIESVLCRRILLARKTIFCSPKFSRDQAVEELAHLTKLNHAHIVRVIGSYVLGREFSILLYPVADCNLSHFMEQMRHNTGLKSINMSYQAGGFFTCLVSALSYIHQNLMKHMDIKPQNVLVRTISIGASFEYKVYITDFGISKAYDNLKDVETDGWTMFTRKYAAPEVVRQATRGFPADVFSLGCVFLELIASISDAKAASPYRNFPYRTVDHQPSTRCWETLESVIKSPDTDQKSYQANIDRLHNMFRSWLRHGNFTLAIHSRYPQIYAMISEDPQARPTALDMNNINNVSDRCCNGGQEALEAFEENTASRDWDY